MEYSPLACISAVSKTLKKLNSIQDIAACLKDTATPMQNSSICTNYRMHNGNSSGLLTQHLPNPLSLPARRTRRAKAWEHYHRYAPSTPRTIMIWKYIVVPSLLLVKILEFSLAVLWIYSGSSRRCLTTIFKGN